MYNVTYGDGNGGLIVRARKLRELRFATVECNHRRSESSRWEKEGQHAELVRAALYRLTLGTLRNEALDCGLLVRRANCKSRRCGFGHPPAFGRRRVLAMRICKLEV